MLARGENRYSALLGSCIEWHPFSAAAQARIAVEEIEISSALSIYDSGLRSENSLTTALAGSEDMHALYVRLLGCPPARRQRCDDGNSLFFR